MHLTDAVNAESDIVRNCHAVFTAIDEMGEYVSSVVVTAKTLQSTPYARKRREESKEPRMC